MVRDLVDMMDSWDKMSMKASLRQIESYQTTDSYPPTLTLDLHPTKLNPNPNLTLTPSFGGENVLGQFE